MGAVPRTPPARPEAASEPVAALERVNAVLASAAHLTRKNMLRPKQTGGTHDWQNEAWYFYDTVGEFRFGVNWKAHALSQCELIIEERVGAEWERDKNDSSVEWQALGMLFDGDAGQSQALATMALHLEVPGETYLVGELLDEDGRPDTAGEDTWRLYSNEEIKPKGQGTDEWEIDRGDGAKRTINAGEDGTAWVIRLWHSHPRRWVEADSPARAALPILRQIENLTKKMAAEIDSRLAGAGILFVPNEITFSGTASTPRGVVRAEGDSDAPEDPTVTQQDANKFLLDLMDGMVTPIANRDHPSSVVPHVVKAPGQWIAAVKHISFAGQLDKATLGARTEEIRRLALTADMPAEIMTGMGDVNHWGSWQLEESAIKIHVEPLGETVTSGLTQQWLKLAVRALGGVWNPNKRIGLDTSKLRLRPDRSEQAQWAHANLLIGDADTLNEIGVDGAPLAGNDLKLALLKKLAINGAASPELVLLAIQALVTGNMDALPWDALQQQPPEGGGPPAIEAPAPVEDPAPTDTGRPDREPPPDDGPPDPVAASAAEVAVLACAELLVKRAMERANNRANRRGKVRKPIEGEALDAALAGAWDDAAGTAARLGLDADWFVDRLDRYTRGVLSTGADHTPRVLERVLGEP